MGRRLGGTGAHRTRVWDLSGDGIRATLEDSLLRLGTDRVDVLLLHDVDHHVREVYETGFPALAKLREEKVVRAIGFGMNDAAGLARFVADLDVDVVLCAGKYTLLDTSAHDELLPLCERRGTAVVLGGVYNSGLLADPRPGASYDYREAPPALVDRAHAARRGVHGVRRAAAGGGAALRLRPSGGGGGRGRRAHPRGGAAERRALRPPRSVRDVVRVGRAGLLPSACRCRMGTGAESAFFEGFRGRDGAVRPARWRGGRCSA